MAQLGLRAFARVTGGKGLHVVIPVERRISWDDAKAFTQGLAHELVRAAPDRYTASMSKARRVGKIFVDYLRNVQEATAIASYSVRAREGAPVACPVGWHELEQAKQPLRFSLGEVLQRVAGRVDPWADFDGARARLSARALRSVIEGQGR